MEDENYKSVVEVQHPHNEFEGKILKVLRSDTNSIVAIDLDVSKPIRVLVSITPALPKTDIYKEGHKIRVITVVPEGFHVMPR